MIIYDDNWHFTKIALCKYSDYVKIYIDTSRPIYLRHSHNAN